VQEIETNSAYKIGEIHQNNEVRYCLFLDWLYEPKMEWKKELSTLKKKIRNKKGTKKLEFFYQEYGNKEKKIAEIFKRQRRNPYVFMRWNSSRCKHGKFTSFSYFYKDWKNYNRYSATISS